MVNSDTPIQLNSLSWDSVSQRQMTAGNRVYQALKDAIVQLQLRPGNALRETEISKQLGVSRQPVREAFFKLADVGLVEIQPQRGTFVQLISRKAVENARFIREAVEVAVVRKAALEASDASIVAIKAHLIEQERAALADDHSGFLRSDEAFHEAIANSVDCNHAWRVVEELKVQMDRVRFLSLPQATPMTSIIAQHRDIADAIASRLPEQAEQAMRAHLSEILISLPVLAAEQSELFRT